MKVFMQVSSLCNSSAKTGRLQGNCGTRLWIAEALTYSLLIEFKKDRNQSLCRPGSDNGIQFVDYNWNTDMGCPSFVMSLQATVIYAARRDQDLHRQRRVGWAAN
jgi:hypothetical protein